MTATTTTPFTTDTDGDGIPDGMDPCPLDSNKQFVGLCGCGVNDKLDSDGDGIPDCMDNCPFDSFKTKPLDCGCGIPETECIAPLVQNDDGIFAVLFNGPWFIAIALVLIIIFIFLCGVWRIRSTYGAGLHKRSGHSPSHSQDLRARGPPALRNWAGSNSPPRPSPPSSIDTRRITHDMFVQQQHQYEHDAASSSSSADGATGDDPSPISLGEPTPPPSTRDNSPRSETPSPNAFTNLQRRIVGKRIMMDGGA